MDRIGSENLVYIRTLLSESLYQHSVNVSEQSKQLARIYHVSEEKAALAGFLHDIAKPLSIEFFNQEQIVLTSELEDLYDQYPAVWHAFAGPVFVQSRFAIQ